MGELWVSIPSEKGLQNITLWEVLYCPDLAFTLVSLLQCNMAGYSAILKDCKCTISNSKGTVVGQIPLTGGLYKHVYAPEAFELANAVCTTQTLDELHWHMGHISPHAIKESVRKEIVIRLTLDSKCQASFHNACAKAKPTCKPVPKEWTHPLAPNLGDKVHLDMWLCHAAMMEKTFSSALLTITAGGVMLS